MPAGVSAQSPFSHLTKQLGPFVAFALAAAVAAPYAACPRVRPGSCINRGRGGKDAAAFVPDIKHHDARPPKLSHSHDYDTLSAAWPALTLDVLNRCARERVGGKSHKCDVWGVDTNS
eukprot:353273-Chlamydomonas_euryale.AAC.11